MCPTAACQLHKKAAQNSHGSWDRAAVGYPVTPGRWDGVPLIPCFPPTQGEMRASICWVWLESDADTSPEGQADPPCLTTTVTPKLLLLLHPILLQWDKGARHSTPAWPLSSSCLCLFLSDFLSLRLGSCWQAGDHSGSDSLQWGCPNVTGLGTVMPPCRVFSTNPHLLKS